MQSRSRPKTSDGTALGYVFVVLAPTGLWASLRGQGETVWGLAWWRRVEILRRGYCGACVPRTEALALGAWCARICGGFAWAVCWLLGCRVTRGGHAREMLRMLRAVAVLPAWHVVASALAMSLFLVVGREGYCSAASIILTRRLAQATASAAVGSTSRSSFAIRYVSSQVSPSTMVGGHSCNCR